MEGGIGKWLDKNVQLPEACLLYVQSHLAAMLAQLLFAFIITAVTFNKNMLIKLLLQSSSYFHTPKN